MRGKLIDYVENEGVICEDVDVRLDNFDEVIYVYEEKKGAKAGSKPKPKKKGKPASTDSDSDSESTKEAEEPPKKKQKGTKGKA